MNDHYAVIKNKYSKFLHPQVSLQYPEGWNKIVDSLFETIETFYNNAVQQNQFPDNPPQFRQLKEKFGTGRFGIETIDGEQSVMDDTLYGIIGLHEDRCSCTCQVCGSNDASLKIKGMLLATRCAAHSLQVDNWSEAQSWKKALDR